jgi:colanic acid/amylovoran biosynthesis protein
MKILIVNAYTRNNGGDAAILSVLIGQLRNDWVKPQITVASMEDPHEYPEFEGCRNIGSIRLFNAAESSFKILRISRKMLALGVELMWPHFPRVIRTKINVILPKMVKSELMALDEADLIISLGGGYLNGTDTLAGNLNIRYILLPIKLAEIIHKPVIMAPQSFGPFGNDYQRNAVRSALNRCQLILVREDTSYKLLKSIGVQEKLTKRLTDAGFAFDVDTKPKKAMPHQRMQIGITARAWMKTKKQELYEQALAEFIYTVCAKYQANIMLIPQVTSDIYQDDDRIVERRIAQLVEKLNTEVEQIEERPNHHQLKQYYEELDFTIGTRFHSVIFSLTSYVPAIAIEYEHKTSGIMHDLGLDKWVIGIEDVTAVKLLNMFNNLVEERDEYIAHLKKVLPAYIEKAEQSSGLIKQAYEQYYSR